MYSRISQAGMISQIFFPANFWNQLREEFLLLIGSPNAYLGFPHWFGWEKKADQQQWQIFWTIVAGENTSQLCGDYNELTQGFLLNNQYSHNRK